MSEEVKAKKAEDKPKKPAAKDGVKVSLDPDFTTEGSVFVSAAGFDPADADADGRVEVPAAGVVVSPQTASALSASPAVKVEE